MKRTLTIAILLLMFTSTAFAWTNMQEYTQTINDPEKNLAVNEYVARIAAFIKKKCPIEYCKHVLIVGDDYVIPMLRTVDDKGNIVYSDSPYVVTSTRGERSNPIPEKKTPYSIRVDVDNNQNNPLANVIVIVDGTFAGLTNAFGYAMVNNVDQGQHEVTIQLNLPPEEGELIYQQTKIINANSTVTVADFEFSPNTSNQVSTASVGEGEFGVQAAPIVVGGIALAEAGLYVYAVVDAASIALDVDDLCSCMYKNSATKDFGLLECADTITACVAEEGGMDGPACKERTRAMNANFDNCPFEYGMLSWDLGFGTGGGIATKVGTVALAVEAGNKGRKLTILDKSITKITSWVDSQTATFTKAGMNWIAQWLPGLQKFRKVFFLNKLTKITDNIATKYTNVADLIANLSPDAKKVFDESIVSGVPDVQKAKAREAVAYANLEDTLGATILKTENTVGSGADFVVKAGEKDIATSVKTFTSNNAGTIKDELISKADALAGSPSRTNTNVIYIQAFEDNLNIVESTVNDVLAGAYGPTVLRNSDEFYVVVSKIPDYLK